MYFIESGKRSASILGSWQESSGFFCRRSRGLFGSVVLAFSGNIGFIAK